MSVQGTSFSMVFIFTSSLRLIWISATRFFLSILSSFSSSLVRVDVAADSFWSNIENNPLPPAMEEVCGRAVGWVELGPVVDFTYLGLKRFPDSTVVSSVLSWKNDTALLGEEEDVSGECGRGEARCPDGDSWPIWAFVNSTVRPLALCTRNFHLLPRRVPRYGWLEEGSSSSLSWSWSWKFEAEKWRRDACEVEGLFCGEERKESSRIDDGMADMDTGMSEDVLERPDGFKRLSWKCYFSHADAAPSGNHPRFSLVIHMRIFFLLLIFLNVV